MSGSEIAFMFAAAGAIAATITATWICGRPLLGAAIGWGVAAAFVALALSPAIALGVIFAAMNDPFASEEDLVLAGDILRAGVAYFGAYLPVVVHAALLPRPLPERREPSITARK